jgi:hypothetical protein
MRREVVGNDALGVSGNLRENIPGLRGESGSGLALGLPEEGEPLPPTGLLYFGVTTILLGCASGFLGMVMVTTPWALVADTFSASTPGGSGMAR